MTTATVFNIQRFSLHDGPGIRTTVFLKGCPLSCAWCHNPESMDGRPEIMVKADRCVGCDLCRPVCEPGLAGRLDLGPAAGRPDASCLRCGECAEACPAGAREMAGRPYTVGELVDEVLRDAPYYAESGGGVTFSGGEPLTGANGAFVLACLEELRGRNVHTAVDTCGHVDPGMLLAAAAVADLVLYDLKLMDDDAHRAACGVGNGRILQNLRDLAATATEVRLRVPLVPGLTDGAENLAAIAGFVADLPRRVPVDLLPFHGLAGDKYGRLGRTWTLDGVADPSADLVKRRVELMQAHGLDASTGG